MSNLLYFLFGVVVMVVVMIVTDNQQRRDFNDYIGKLEKARDRWRDDFIAMADERDQGRDTNRRLHRRVQAVEDWTNDKSAFYQLYRRGLAEIAAMHNKVRAHVLWATNKEEEAAELRGQMERIGIICTSAGIRPDWTHDPLGEPIDPEHPPTIGQRVLWLYWALRDCQKDFDTLAAASSAETAALRQKISVASDTLGKAICKVTDGDSSGADINTLALAAAYVMGEQKKDLDWANKELAAAREQIAILDPKPTGFAMSYLTSVRSESFSDDGFMLCQKCGKKSDSPMCPKNKFRLYNGGWDIVLDAEGCHFLCPDDAEKESETP